MTIVVVHDKTGDIKLKMKAMENENIGNIKRRLCQVDSKPICILYNGVPLDDAMLIDAYGSEVTLTVEYDIEFTDISTDTSDKYTYFRNPSEQPVLVPQLQPANPSNNLTKTLKSEVENRQEDLSQFAGKNSAIEQLNKNDIAANPGAASASTKSYIHNGRRYNIISRQRRIRLLDFMRGMNSTIARQIIIHALMLSAFYLLGTPYFLFLWIVCISVALIGQGPSLARFLSALPLTNTSKAIIMFFMSFICLNHSSFFIPPRSA